MNLQARCKWRKMEENEEDKKNVKQKKEVEEKKWREDEEEIRRRVVSNYLVGLQNPRQRIVSSLDVLA